MENALPRVSVDGGNGGLLMAVVGRLRALARSRTLSKADERLKAAIEATSAIGAPLLDAESLDDFSKRIDASVEDKRLAGYFNQLARALTAEDTIAEQLGRIDDSAHEWVTEVLGEGQRPLAVEADRLMRTMAAAYEDLRRTFRLTLRVEVSPVLWDENDPLGFLHDRDIPPRIAGAMLDMHYANACFLAIIRAGITRRKLEPWLARAIAERWVQGIRRQLVLLASVPGTHIAEDIVPQDQRLDLEALVRENEDAKVAMDRFHGDADEANVDVFAPDFPR